MSGSGKTIADIIQEKRGKETADCYQIVDGRSRPQMLTVERITASNFLLAYQNFDIARLNAEHSKIDAEFREKLLIIHGSGLEPIFEGLSDHRITYLRELPSACHVELVSPAITRMLLDSEIVE